MFNETNIEFALKFIYVPYNIGVFLFNNYILCSNYLCIGYNDGF